MSTLAQFRTAVSAKMGLDNTASSAEQSLMDGWINEGVIEVLLRTRCYISAATMNLTANQMDYTLDTGILAINEVYTTSGNTSWQLDRMQPAAILQLRRASAAASSPVRYYALNGASLLMIYPGPASSSDTITMYYVARPTALSLAADDPSIAANGGIPLEYHKAIEWWACYQAGDYVNDTPSQNGELYRQTFEDAIKRIRKEMAHKGGRNLGRVIPGRSRTPLAPHDPSTDLRWN